MVFLNRTIIILSFMVFFCAKCYAQKEDHKWLFGLGINIPLYTSNGDLDTTEGITIIDFNYDPPLMKYDSSLYCSFFGSNSNISDKEGKLLLSSNGLQIYSGKSKIVLADTIAYGQYWEDSKIKNSAGKVLSYGSAFVGSSIILPLPNKNNIYQLFYSLWDNSFFNIQDIHTRNLYNAEIDMSSLNDPGTVVFKDNLLLNDSIFKRDSLAVGGFAACRHANGRDWWLVHPGKYQNTIYTFLLNNKGIHLQEVQESGERVEMGVGQVCFSPDGNKLAINSLFKFSNDGSKVLFFDFDRCTGKITNPKGQHFQAGYGVSNGLAFSPDSRYVYASNDQFIYQYDFHVEDIVNSRKLVGEYDGYLYVYPGTSTGFPVTLGWMGQAPDGRIYVSSGSGSNHKMGVIQYPNETAQNCGLQQHSIHITTNYDRTMPNFPNYRLGPLDGSECDTLGLDNNPIAKFRYDQDTLDYLKVHFTDLSYFRPESWSWDFGDGKSSTERYPYHNFPTNGTYEVCLTVSNENSNNITCRMLTFGTVSTEDAINKEIDVNLYPNPVKDILNLTIYDYLPQNGIISIFDNKGQMILTQKVYNGWNNVDMSKLIPASYFYNISDDGKIIKSGKIIKGIL